MTTSRFLAAFVAAISCHAQSVVSPPVQMLAPPVNDFPRKGPAIALADRWEDLTRGANLALGKPYRFSRQPNYSPTRDAGDAVQLTDGKIIKGDHIWYYKAAVGYRSCEPPAIVCIDLGKVHPIAAVLAHVQGGGAHEGSLRYPLRFDVYVSDDDKTYHLVDSVSKKQFADQPGAVFDLPESRNAPPPGDPHTHAFHFGSLRTRGRYVALQMVFAGAYNALDEIAVMAGDHDASAVTFDTQYATRLIFDGVELLYTLPCLQVPVNVAGGFSFAVRDSRRDTSQPVTFRLSVPSDVRLSWSGQDEPLEARRVTRGGQPYVEHSLTVKKPSTTLRYFYVKADSRPEGDMYFRAECDGFVQPEQRVTLVPIDIPAAPRLKRLFLALGWTGIGMQSRWPGAPEVFGHLGFTHASVGSWETPSLYKKPETARSQRWLDEQARGAGLKVCMTDSPFHIMAALWARRPDFAEAYMQTRPASKRLCLSYRGKYYQKEIERIAQRYRYRKPDVVFFDVECFGGADKRVEKCERCRKLLHERGRSPKELATDLYAEAAGDIADALNRAADEMGRPRPLLGYYHVGPAYNYHNVFDFAKMHPKGVQIANPEVYVRCWPPAVAEIVRRDKKALPPGCQLITWTSPGTLNWEGECPPARYFDALMETFFNGGIGSAYYTPWNLSPGDLLAQAQAARVVGPVEDIIADSTLVEDVVCEAGAGHISAVRSGEEMLLLVGEFEHLGDVDIAVRVPVDRPADAIDLFTGKQVAALTPKDNRLTVTVSGAYRTRPFYIGSQWARRAAPAE